MSEVICPYEYIDGKLGVQARFLFDGKNAHRQSLRLIGERGLRRRIETSSIYRLRAGRGKEGSAVLSYGSLPTNWQNLLTKHFGLAPDLVKKSLFEKLYEREWRPASFSAHTASTTTGRCRKIPSKNIRSTRAY
ncbi:MAG: hypothetical protein LBG92_10440 [Prevotellaceae bacterium]|nr:hypothetical protein [Prevotellaceae bacterium]